MRSAASSLPRPVVSVVLCTYNRSHLLAQALDALLGQIDETPSYEVIVVDNNSIDATRDVVDRVLASGIVRYEFEPCQGLSVARNHGVSVARADLIAFTDDDVRVSATWVQSIVEVFNDNPGVAMVGGKVEPVWDEAPPPWLPEAGTAPLALVDFGEDAFRITPERSVCLIGANVAVRRRAFERAGGFSIALQRVRDGIGSTEDHDFQIRVLADGVSALYQPLIVVQARVPPERLMKRYHRAWHRGHGRFYALMREPSFERSQLGRFLGVPAHVYRRALQEAAGWGASLLTRRSAAAFAHELRLRFLVGFAVQRIFHGYDQRA
jgi:glycosyltransferase involved in cell wall biosynthesis